jgi:Ca2+-binding RTX toxin-like protein
MGQGRRVARKCGEEIAMAKITGDAADNLIDATHTLTGQPLPGDDDDRIFGLGGVDELFSLGGNDLLDGGAGPDTMAGGAGSDRYRVDDSADQVIEAVGRGHDRVWTSIDYVLAAGQEMERLQANDPAGTSAIDLTGNEFGNSLLGNAGDNILIGGAGNDFISGGTGNDRLEGGAGNDHFRVDNAADRVIEAASAGFDRVSATASYTLEAGQAIEALRAYDRDGTTAINLTGNSFANAVKGNDGNNVIDGGAGNDRLFGLGGADTFSFSTALNATTNVDTVADFNVAADTIQLENGIFAGLVVGTLTVAAFHIGGGAHDADDRIIYDTTRGALLFDADGSGSGAAVQFAKVSGGLALTNTDFFIV